MLRVLALIAGLLFVAPSSAQLGMTGVGPGGFGTSAGATVTLVNDNPKTRSNPALTTASSTSDQTVTGSLTNPALAVWVINCGTPGAISGVTATWDPPGANQAMTLVGNSANIFLFGLRNPTAGTNKFITISWTGASQIVQKSTSFSNVNQSSNGAAFSGFNSATNAAPISVPITSTATSAVVGGFVSVANFTSTSGTQAFIDNACSVEATAGNTATGAASVTMTGNPGSAVFSEAAGFSVNP